MKATKFYHNGVEWTLDIGGAVVGVSLKDGKRCYILPEWATGELRQKIKQHLGK